MQLRSRQWLEKKKKQNEEDREPNIFQSIEDNYSEA